MPGELDARTAKLLVDLGDAEDLKFRNALITFLTVNPSDALAAVFGHPALRRRTVQALALIATQADKQDRAGVPLDVREKAKTLRAAASGFRRKLKELDAADALAAATLHKRARARLAEEFADELVALAKEKGGNPKKPSQALLRLLAFRHRKDGRYFRIVSEERGPRTS